MLPLQEKYKHVLIDIDRKRFLGRDLATFLRPRPKPKKAYPNSDRFAEDGRRIYSAYDATTVASPGRKVWAKRIRIAAIVIAVIAVVLAAIVISVLPH
jgi:hypothetical protein